MTLNGNICIWAIRRQVESYHLGASVRIPQSAFWAALQCKWAVASRPTR